MPELPEVETIRVGLGRLLPGLFVDSVTYDFDKSFPNPQTDVEKFLIGASVVDVDRRGKALIIKLSSKYSLVIHLKMTGQLVYVKNPKNLANISETKMRFGAGHPSDSLINSLPDKSTRVVLRLHKSPEKINQKPDTDDQYYAKLFFNDQRKFGWVRLLPTAEVPNIDFFKKLGPEPLSADFTQAMFRQRVKRRANTKIKAALLDQTVLAGIGNIYADESLWGARINPNTLVKNLTPSKLNKLFCEIQDVLKLAIKAGGSTDKNYVNAEGKRGSYLSFAKVFRRENLPCPRCGTSIEKSRVAGRGTHICPKCQRSPI